MKFWVGYDFEVMSVVNHFKQSKMNEEDGTYTIEQILGYQTSIEAICAVSMKFCAA